MTECIVSTGFKEDAMVVKSGEGEYGLRLNAPSRCVRSEASVFSEMQLAGRTGCDATAGIVCLAPEMRARLFSAMRDLCLGATLWHGLCLPCRGVTFRGCSVVQGHAISIGAQCLRVSPPYTPVDATLSLTSSPFRAQGAR